MFDEFHWFQPTRYWGVGTGEHRLSPGTPVPLDEFVNFCHGEKEDASHSLWVMRSDHEFLVLSIAKPDGEFRYVGSLAWMTRASFSMKQAWREAHAVQVARLMKLLRSPYGFAALSSDEQRKINRLVPHENGVGSSLEFTVHDYSEGLAGVFWRNFYGPPFVELFGDRLKALPPGTCTDQGDGVVLVQPYPLPSDAETPQGQQQEAHLLSLLGPEHFYDFQTHSLPKRRPRL